MYSNGKQTLCVKTVSKHFVFKRQVNDLYLSELITTLFSNGRQTLCIQLGIPAQSIAKDCALFWQASIQTVIENHKRATAIQRAELVVCNDHALVNTPRQWCFWDLNSWCVQSAQQRRCPSPAILHRAQTLHCHLQDGSKHVHSIIRPSMVNVTPCRLNEKRESKGTYK
jgi:hypothetical protein